MSEEIEQKSELAEKEQIVDRIPDDKGRMVFPPGVSGNPAGRPKGSKNFTTKVVEALEKIAEGKDYTYEEALVKTVLKKAIIDQDQQMIKLIWNYLDGMPAQKMDLTTLGEKLPIYGGQSLQNNNSDQKDIPTDKKD